MSRARVAATGASGSTTTGVPGGFEGRRYSVAVTPEPAPGGTDADAGEPAVTALEHENRELRAELAAAEAKAAHPKRRRRRTIGSWVLLVLACVLAVTSVVVVYARNQLLNTDTFVSTLAPLASDPAVQAAVATKVSDSLVAQTDLEQQIKDALPARADFLAGPITSTVRSTAYSLTLKLVQSSQFKTLWEQSLRRSHQQLDNLLTGSDQGPFSAANGQVTVDLSRVETAAKAQLAAHGLSVFDKVPQYKGAPFVLFESKQLQKIQRLVKVLDSLAYVLPILALVLFALSVLLARDRRRGLVHAAAGLAVSMAVLLVGANVGRNQYLASLLPGQSRNATAAVIDTVDAALLDSVRTVLIVAAVVAVAAFGVGLAPVRRWLTDRKQPAWMTGGRFHDVVVVHRPAFQWLAVVLGLVVLVLWNQPTVFVAIVVVLVTFALVVLVGLFGRGAPGAPRPPVDGEVSSGVAGA